LQFLIKKEKKIFSCNFFSIFGHLSPGSVLDLDLDPDPYWSPTSNSGSGKNEYGSTTHTYVFSVGGGGYGVLGPQTDKHLTQSPFTSQLF
jgi:hypothetical protein